MSNHIDCLIVDDEPVARDVLQSHLEKIDFVNVVGSCKSALEAYSVLNSKKIDLVFLDINMPEVSGLSLAKAINKNIRVIFTTAYREYAVEGFNLNAVDYLLKPISFERLLQSINKLNKSRFEPVSEVPVEIPEERPDFIFVRSDRKMVRIDFSEIEYIESLGDYLKIHLNINTVVTRETISNIEAKLPVSGFLRTHRSYIVAMAKVRSYTNEYIEIGNKVIPISRNYKTSVLDKLENLSS